MALVNSDSGECNIFFITERKALAHRDAGYEGLHSDPEPSIFRQGSSIYIEQLKL